MHKDIETSAISYTRCWKWVFLAFATVAPLQVFAFLGMNATATLQGPLPAWTKQFGATGATPGVGGAATDTAGNVFIAGETNIGLDGNTQTGTQDFFVTKYSPSGSRLWTRQLGVASYATLANGVATDSSGNVFVAGYTAGGLDGNSLTGIYDFYVTKYDTSGNKQWTKQMGVASESTYGNAVTTDPSGNIFVAGHTSGGLDGNTLSGPSNTDLFVTKYDSSGTKLWTKQLGPGQSPSDRVYAYAVAADLSGNVFVAGTTNVPFDGQAQVGSYDMYVTKFDSGGNKQWTRQLGAPSLNISYAYGAVTDSSGNVFITGYTMGNFDGHTKTGTMDLVVAKLDSAGNKQWTAQLGVASKLTQGYAATTDAFGNVFVTGGTTGGLNGNSLKGSNDLFVTKYTSSGLLQWTKQLGVASATTGGAGVAIDSLGHLYVAGTTNGGLDNNTLTGTYDIYVSQYIGN